MESLALELERRRERLERQAQAEVCAINKERHQAFLERQEERRLEAQKRRKEEEALRQQNRDRHAAFLEKRKEQGEISRRVRTLFGNRPIQTDHNEEPVHILLTGRFGLPPRSLPELERQMNGR